MASRRSTRRRLSTISLSLAGVLLRLKVGLIKTGTILSDQISTKAIIAEKIDTNAVTTEKISAIIADKIASDAVTTEKITRFSKKQN